jgi:hypothetical protein
MPLSGLLANGPLVLAELRNRNLDTMWFETVSRAGGVAYQSLVQSGQPYTDKQALLAAAAQGAKYIAERMPDTVAARHIQSPDLMDVVHGELGKLLARDPNVAPQQPPIVGAS